MHWPARQRLGTPEVTLGLLPGNGGTQRLTRQVGRRPRARAAAHRPPGHARRGAALGLVGRVFADEAAFDEHVARLAAGSADGDRRDQALRPRRRRSYSFEARSRARTRGASSSCSARRTPSRAWTAFVEKRGAGVRGRVSTTTPTTVERGAFVHGAAEPIGRDVLTHHRPRDRRGGRGAFTRFIGRDGRPRRALRSGGASERGRAAAITDRGADPARRRRGPARADVDELAPGAGRRAGQDPARGVSSNCARRPTRSGTTPGLAKAGARDRECTGSIPASKGRVLRRPLGVVASDRAVELPHHAAERQARSGAAVRQHRRGQARRHDPSSPRCASPRSSPARACRPASSTASPGPAPVAGEALVEPPAGAQGGLHRIDAPPGQQRGRAGRHGAPSG